VPRMTAGKPFINNDQVGVLLLGQGKDFCLSAVQIGEEVSPPWVLKRHYPYPVCLMVLTYFIIVFMWVLKRHYPYPVCSLQFLDSNTTRSTDQNLSLHSKRDDDLRVETLEERELPSQGKRNDGSGVDDDNSSCVRHAPGPLAQRRLVTGQNAPM